jgi:probable phosphoglycerate mutase
LVAYVDGGSRGNPGPAGYGVWIRDGNGTTVETLSEFLGETTNNVAEYRGLLAALEYAAAHQAERLAVYCDSELVARQMQGRYRVKSLDLKPLFERAQELARRLTQFSIAHIPREQNSFADRLANEAMDRRLSGAPRPRRPVSPALSRVEGSAVEGSRAESREAQPKDGSPTHSFAAVVRGGKLQPLPPLPHLEEGAEYEVRVRRRVKARKKSGATES